MSGGHRQRTTSGRFGDIRHGSVAKHLPRVRGNVDITRGMSSLPLRVDSGGRGETRALRLEVDIATPGRTCVPASRGTNI